MSSLDLVSRWLWARSGARGLLAALVALTVGLGCNAILGFEEGRAGGADANGGSGQGGGVGAGGATGGTGGVEPGDCASQNPGWRCVPEAPPGWQGPAVLWLGAPALAPVSCPTGFDLRQQAYHGIQAPAASCTECSCAVQCAWGDLHLSELDNCQDPGQIYPQDHDNCVAAPSAPWLSVLVTAPTTTCDPTGGDATLPPVTWQEQALICEAAVTGTGCPTGVCIPDAGAFPTAGPCVWSAGDVPCPQGYAELQPPTLYAGFVEQRGCEPCDCQITQQCAAQTHIDDEPGCPYPNCIVPHGAVCQTLCTSWVHFQREVTAAGACSPTATQPTGDALEDQPMTVCCAG